MLDQSMQDSSQSVTAAKQIVSPDCIMLDQSMACSAPAKVVDKPSWQAPHQMGLFPVSVEWEPPFTMLVDLIGHGDHMVCSLCRSDGCYIWHETYIGCSGRHHLPLMQQPVLPID